MKEQKLKSYFDEANGNITQLKTDYFHPIDFIRKEFNRRRSASPFDPYRVLASPNYWSGIGFIDIVLNGDTLKIKNAMQEISADNGSYSFSGAYSPLQLFYDENVDFFIILDDSRFYLIRPKK